MLLYQSGWVSVSTGRIQTFCLHHCRHHHPSVFIIYPAHDTVQGVRGKSIADVDDDDDSVSIWLITLWCTGPVRTNDRTPDGYRCVAQSSRVTDSVWRRPAEQHWWDPGISGWVRQSTNWPSNRQELQINTSYLSRWKHVLTIDRSIILPCCNFLFIFFFFKKLKKSSGCSPSCIRKHVPPILFYYQHNSCRCLSQ